MWNWEISEDLLRIQNTLFIYLKTLGNSASKLVEHIGSEIMHCKVNIQWFYTLSKLKICEGGNNIGSMLMNAF